MLPVKSAFSSGGGEMISKVIKPATLLGAPCFRKQKMKDRKGESDSGGTLPHSGGRAHCEDDTRAVGSPPETELLRCTQHCTEAQELKNRAL